MYGALQGLKNELAANTIDKSSEGPLLAVVSLVPTQLAADKLLAKPEGTYVPCTGG